VSKHDDQRREPTTTYDTRGIPLPGLRRARQRLGLTQRELASLAGIGQGTVCKLETLQRGAYPQTLQKLALALGVTPADLRAIAMTNRRRLHRPSSKYDSTLRLSTPHIRPQQGIQHVSIFYQPTCLATKRQVHKDKFL
jgi:transcriptional regulator with XRE-family HTH domain